jgi:hypothetical protein
VRRLLPILVAAAILGPPIAAGAAETAPVGGGASQNVNVENTQAGTVLARAGLQVARTGRTNASPSNLALADAHDCASPCQAIAAAFQVVLIPEDTQVQAPKNAAVAANVNCAGCGAFAFAYQYVVTVARATTLDASAEAQIAALRQEADQDVHAGLPYPTLDTRLADLGVRFRAAVDGGLTRQGVGESNQQANQDAKQQPPA